MDFFISDTHFGHKRILELCNRPFDTVEQMNDWIVKRWNETVKPEDTVYHLGDVALGPIHESLANVKRLNGYKILIDGNHDRRFMNRHNPEKAAHWEKVYLDNGFADVVSSEAVLVNGIYPAFLSHFPYDGDSHDGDRYEDQRLYDGGTLLIHGHTHSADIVTRSKNGTLQIHVGVDAWAYKPVSSDEIVKVIQSHGL